MSDYKSGYSDESKNYIDNKVPNSELDQGRYNSCKEREAKFNDRWNRQKVSINEVVDKFVPEGSATIIVGDSYKYKIIGKDYEIRCDKVAGCLRVYNRNRKQFCKIDGTPSENLDLTHFKIKRREEM